MDRETDIAVQRRNIWGLYLSRSVLQGFEHVGGFNGGMFGEVGDGAGEFDGAVIAARREFHTARRRLKRLFRFWREAGKVLDFFGSHIGIGRGTFRFRESFTLE